MLFRGAHGEIPDTSLREPIVRELQWFAADANPGRRRGSFARRNYSPSVQGLPGRCQGQTRVIRRRCKLPFLFSARFLEVPQDSSLPFITQVHVFHTYPFLEVAHRAFLSCREFVKNQLPEWQTNSPEALGGQAEQEMEEEIDSRDAKVVDGDGVEVSLEDAVDDGWAGETSQDESSSEQGTQEDMSSSWIKLEDEPEPSPWPSPPTSDDEDHTLCDTSPKVQRPPPAQTNEGGWPAPLKHIQSTISSIVQATSASLVGGGSSQPQPESPRPPSQIPSPSSPRFKTSGGSVPTIQTPAPQPSTSSPTKRHHRRTPSSQYPLRGALHGSTGGGNGFLNIEPHEQAPPRPVVRRMTSHPDISSLCDSWVSTGPASQTVNFYKTSPSSFLNSVSLAFTQVRPSGSTTTSRSGGQDGKSTHQHQTTKSMSNLFFTSASSQH
jgi:hypothetical protein